MPSHPVAICAECRPSPPGQPLCPHRGRRCGQRDGKTLRLYSLFRCSDEAFQAAKQTQATADFQQQGVVRQADPGRKAAGPAGQVMHCRSFPRSAARHQQDGRGEHARRGDAGPVFDSCLSCRIVTDEDASLLDNGARRGQRGVGFERKARQMEGEPKWILIHLPRTISAVAAHRA